jgi:hypothetical protein
VEKTLAPLIKVMGGAPESERLLNLKYATRPWGAALFWWRLAGTSPTRSSPLGFASSGQPFRRARAACCSVGHLLEGLEQRLDKIASEHEDVVKPNVFVFGRPGIMQHQGFHNVTLSAREPR